MRKRYKYVKRDYDSMHPVAVYDLVRSRKLKKFPSNYLEHENIKVIVRHVFLKELKLKRKEILAKVDHKFLMKLHMGGFRKFFGNKDFNVIIYCFPEMDIHMWEFRRVEPQFWSNKENQKEFLLWVMKKENINPESKEDLRRLTARTVINYGGSRIFKVEPDFYTILCSVIGDRYKEWEIMKLRVWTDEKVIAAVKWLVEEKMNYTLEQACKLKTSDFRDNNLDGMLQKVCNHSVLYALNLAYGNCFVRDSIRSMKLISEAN